MSWFSVDVEADGPCPGLYSMTEIGATLVRPGASAEFEAFLRPLPDAAFDTEYDSHSPTPRQKTLLYPDPEIGTRAFCEWVESVTVGRPMFASDNNGFDWQFVNYYLWRFCGRNPFGHSSTNIGSLYKGIVKTMRHNFKHLRDTPHTHRAVEDARGNAEALLKFRDQLGLNITFE